MASRFNIKAGFPCRNLKKSRNILNLISRYVEIIEDIFNLQATMGGGCHPLCNF
jgi:hypothetical protein